MAEGWQEREGGYFTRVEARLVTLELRSESNEATLKRLEPIVDALQGRNEVAAAIAAQLSERGNHRVRLLTAMIATLALIVPPILTAVLVRYGFR